MFFKHDAFLSDFAAHEARVGEIGTLADELDQNNYFRKDELNQRYAVCKSVCLYKLSIVPCAYVFSFSIICVIAQRKLFKKENCNISIER
jgi:hypothetical protein